MRWVPSGRSRAGVFRLLSSAGASLLALTVVVSVSCSGRTERRGPDHAAAGGALEPGAAGTAGADGSGEGGNSSGPATGEACDGSDIDSCGSDDDLCCVRVSGPKCVPSSLDDCGKCGAACGASAASKCVDGECACGEEPACSGQTPYCLLEHCVQCRHDADCAEPGLTQCVEGSCEQCDPAENTGCSGYAAACNEDASCVRCSEKYPCPAPLYCDLDDSRCKGCAQHQDCGFANAPICVVIDDVFSECQACESDDECAERDPERGQCLEDGTCSPCEPSTDEGCGNQECLYDPEGGYSCQGCEDHSTCDNFEKPLCDAETHTCVPCNDPSLDESESCGGRSPGAPVCVTSGEFEGYCAFCNPETNEGCWTAAPFCADDGLSCEECLAPGDCADGFECSPNQECVGCTSDADCAGNPAGAQCVSVQGGKACRHCDPDDHAGCGPPTPICNDVFACDPAPQP